MSPSLQIGCARRKKKIDGRRLGHGFRAFAPCFVAVQYAMILYVFLEKPLVGAYVDAESGGGAQPEGFMSVNAAMIEQMILEGIPDATVKVEDLRGDGEHYAAYVVSPSFAGKTRVQQHKMVFDAMKGKMGDELHALALQTSVPE